MLIGHGIGRASADYKGSGPSGVSPGVIGHARALVCITRQSARQLPEMGRGENNRGRLAGLLETDEVESCSRRSAATSGFDVGESAPETGAGAVAWGSLSAELSLEASAPGGKRKQEGRHHTRF